MDPKPSNSGMLLAPPHGGTSIAAQMPSARTYPPLEKPIVKPETREEVVRGRRMHAMPALAPHADQHFNLDFVLGAHVKPGYVGSSDLLTRPGHGSNFATDTCIRRDGEDPTTGERYLEEVAFEVVNEQSLADITERAEDLVARGVRRVLAIFVKKGEVSEWSARTRAWQALGPKDAITDPLLARPLHVKELLDAAESRNAVARALLVQDNPVLVEAQAESRRRGVEQGVEQGIEQGLAAGLVESIEEVCDLLAVPLTPAHRAQMTGLDPAALRALRARIRALRRWP